MLHDINFAIQYTGMSRTWLYKCMRAGRLKFYKMGKALRFSRQDLDALVQSGRVA
jgi:excisionase family DNA binding protein